MKKLFLLAVVLAVMTIASGCGFRGFSGIKGETIIAPLSAILSHPVTAKEEPDFYRRRWLNSQPHRNHYRSKDRRWSSTYKLRGDTR